MRYNLIVIGSGPAGQKAALQAAKAGKTVVVIENCEALGGSCVQSGTLPSKSFRESVYRWSLSSQGSLSQDYDPKSAPKTSGKKSVTPDMARLLRRRDRVVEGEAQVIYDQLKRNNIDTIVGLARLLSKNEVEVDTGQDKKIVQGDYIMVAVGAAPVAPQGFSVDGKTVLDSESILKLKKIPGRLVVLGAGIIGCEYASMFAMAGTKVHLVDRRNEILASCDREIVNHLVELFVHQGMELVLETEAERIEKTTSGCIVHLKSGRKIETDVVLIALGRQGNTMELGLEKAGVIVNERGIIPVNERFETNVPNILAAGDVIGAPALASTSMEQGRLASAYAFGIETAPMSPWYPYGIYTIPEISMVGPTEEELIARKADFVTGRAKYREMARGQIVGDQWGLLKLLVDRQTLKILGVHIIGDSAADLVHIGQAVMAFGGDVNYFIRNVFNYPTLAEAYKTAAFHAINQIRGLSKSV